MTRFIAMRNFIKARERFNGYNYTLLQKLNGYFQMTINGISKAELEAATAGLINMCEDQERVVDTRC